MGWSQPDSGIGMLFPLQGQQRAKPTSLRGSWLQGICIDSKGSCTARDPSGLEHWGHVTSGIWHQSLEPTVMGNIKKKKKPSSSFSVSSGHDPSPTEVCGRFATIPSKCRSVLPSLFPHCLRLAFLPRLSSPSLCWGQRPWPRQGFTSAMEVCRAAGSQPISNQQTPTSAGRTGSRSSASSGERPPAPELPAMWETCSFKFISLFQPFH